MAAPQRTGCTSCHEDQELLVSSNDKTGDRPGDQTGTRAGRATETPLAPGDFADQLNELFCRDCELWGHPVDAAIVRCVAAANWKTGRGAKVRGVSQILGISVATVHDRLKRLQNRRDPETGEPAPVVQQTASGYELSDRAATRLIRELHSIAGSLARFMARMEDPCRLNHGGGKTHVTRNGAQRDRADSGLGDRS